MDKKLLLMKQFPLSIIGTKWEDMPMTNPSRFVRTMELVREEPSTIFLYKDGGAAIDNLIEGGRDITSFRAIDFAAYFSAVIEEKVYTVRSDVLYIYNIGTELSNSTTFSDKVLHKLVQHNKDAGNTTLIASDYYNSSTFGTKYNLTDQLVDSRLQVLK